MHLDSNITPDYDDSNTSAIDHDRTAPSLTPARQLTLIPEALRLAPTA